MHKETQQAHHAIGADGDNMGHSDTELVECHDIASSPDGLGCVSNDRNGVRVSATVPLSENTWPQPTLRCHS